MRYRLALCEAWSPQKWRRMRTVSCLLSPRTIIGVANDMLNSVLRSTLSPLIHSSWDEFELAQAMILSVLTIFFCLHLWLRMSEDCSMAFSRRDTSLCRSRSSRKTSSQSVSRSVESAGRAVWSDRYGDLGISITSAR